jgi:hypothetical protein
LVVGRVISEPATTGVIKLFGFVNDLYLHFFTLPPILMIGYYVCYYCHYQTLPL